MQLAYLYSRYPVLSQTFCDMEMLELERRGYDLLIGSVHAPLTSLRHEHFEQFRSPIYYAPPAAILDLWERKTRTAGRWPETLIAQHDQRYGPAFKARLRARNASYFADLFARNQIQHFHVHFANRAAHTAIFLREISGIPFSVTAHGQDFMSDLGQEDLLKEICAAAEFVAVETDYSRELLRQRCPESAEKIFRVYNGLDLSSMTRLGPGNATPQASSPVTIVSIGRLVPFKGFEILIDACAQLSRSGNEFRCEIIGDGPLRQKLATQIAALNLERVVTLCGSLSQSEVYRKLQTSDLFALASVVDRRGASDIFPTVILEAMKCGKPVVSTTVAGIPEAVANGVTGLLVAPGDSVEFAEALGSLIRNSGLREKMGVAGRERIENNFAIEKTILPLEAQLKPRLTSRHNETEVPVPRQREVAYLIDRWPDDNLPLLADELRTLQRNAVPYLAFVFQPPIEAELRPKTNDLAMSFAYFPDPMLVEAEWQANRPLAHELESIWADQKHRAPSAYFLRQARAALILRRMFGAHNITHVHATSSRTLLCGYFLKRLLGLSLSAAIESRPTLSEAVIQALLEHTLGGVRRTGTRASLQAWSEQLTAWIHNHG
jgi:glycosyltransferase involved in cell wall biosynthesis